MHIDSKNNEKRHVNINYLDWIVKCYELLILLFAFILILFDKNKSNAMIHGSFNRIAKWFKYYNTISCFMNQNNNR